MALNTIYALVTALALSGWAVLAATVFTTSARLSAFARAVPVVLAITYAVIMATILPFEGGTFGSIAGLASLFGQPEIALVGWIHYLAFDLFIGGWQVHSATEVHLPKGVILFSLLLTMILGPVGLLFFLSTKWLFLNYRRVSDTGLSAMQSYSGTNR